MAIQLFGDPYGLQGGGQNLQGGSVALQGGYNPQQVYGPTFAPQPAPKPSPAPAPKRVAAPRPLRQLPAPVRQPTQPVQPITPWQVNPQFASLVGNRISPVDPTKLEWFNAETGKGFGSEQELYRFIGAQTGQLITSLNQLRAQQGASQLPASIPLPAELQTDPNADLAQAAAQAGLSMDDFLKLVGGQYGVTPDERGQIEGQLGLPQAYEQLFKPSPSTQELYNQAYSQAGLADIKNQFQALQTKINDIQAKYTTKGGEINENPFLSEASRMGRQKSLEELRQNEIGNLTTQAQQLADLYNQGLSEVSNVVTRTTTDFSNNQQVNALKLQYLQQQAERQIGDLQAKKSSQAYTYLPDYLKAKAKAQKPDTIGSAEAGYYRWNPDTGTFEQVIAPKAPNDSFSLGFDPITGQPYVLNKNTGTLNGGGGSGGNVVANLAQQVMNNPALLYNLPEAQQKAVNAYLAGNGAQIPTELTPEQKNKVASIGTLQQTISAIESLGSQLDWSGVGGAFKGSISQFLAKNFGTGSQQEQMLRSYIGNLQATIAKERGGTSFTANEQALLEQYTPTINDSPLVIQSKLQALKAYLGGQVQGFGGQQPQQQGGVNPSDPLGLFSSVGNTSASTRTAPPTTGARTDRHNNPTAFTTDVAKTAGLRLGIDYTVGDPFPNNPNLRTARLIGDPIEKTVQVIDRIGFYTQSGKPRWSYINSIPQAKNWSSLSYAQKANVIKQMYAREGGKALLNNFA